MSSSAVSLERLYPPSLARDCVGAFDAYLARSGRANATRIKYAQILRDLERRVSPNSLLDLDAAEIDLEA